ncbi:3-hydroxyacyl-CoA dehydrogenase NAD-binding domain-containing protein [Saccharospirillum salsuginis]|uniref:3-hydroxyacyl-CoA dehydrogenase PaaC n=1 Tax=Saccharospirillum salsuginis TaxID=418750 RepID=A0A918NGE4_9GAMM|nr:3-hydroxyacyl-CoA dehydrogenase NAD-binding domain-containing protein [Saccharospirillum salsuginis]GGX68654.1 3-hydroxyacyl-CoA dehydrogenase PaaC [Saccharospirillum salsuginis]
MNTPHHIAVIGAGIMGQGIAQVMAQAGHRVSVFDVADGAAEAARTAIGEALARRVSKGRLSEADRQATIDRLHPVDRMDDLADADLVVEAIVERLDVKHAVFQELETVCSTDTLLCTNTSSLSVTDIADGLRHPQRLFGLHFFNPAPVMKLVEVVNTRDSDPALQRMLLDWVPTLGKQPVSVADSPGFIVNRCARPFYSESLVMLEQNLATPEVIDDCLTANLGVPLGPFALMDLVGLDINLAATETLWRAFDHHPRFRPAVSVRDRVEAGQLGRKTGQGFYPHPRPKAEHIYTARVDGSAALVDRLQAELPCAVVISDGRSADRIAAETAQPVLLLDQSFIDWTDRPATLAYTASGYLDEGVCEMAEACAAKFGVGLIRVPDKPGLIAQRLVTMLFDEADRVARSGVAEAGDIDTALRNGLNFRLGPFALAEQLTDPVRERIRARLTEQDTSGRYQADPVETPGP